MRRRDLLSIAERLEAGEDPKSIAAEAAQAVISEVEL
jgi:hypothetical protein